MIFKKRDKKKRMFSRMFGSYTIGMPKELYDRILEMSREKQEAEPDKSDKSIYNSGK